MSSINGNNKAFTLVEMQLAALITTIISLAAIALYIFYLRTFIIDNAYLDVYSNSRIAVDYMARDMRLASQIVSNRGSYTTSDNTIILMVPSIDDSVPPDVINTISSTGLYYDYIIYNQAYNSTSKDYDLYRIVQIDDKFNNLSDPYYARNGRANENRVIARYSSNLLTFSSGSVGGQSLSQVPNLSTVDAVGISLPINQQLTSLSGAGQETAQLIPTTVVRLRNK